MKNILSLLFVSLLLFSCGKEELKEVEVFKACANVSFLKVDADYYRVCNIENLDGVETGTMLKLAYKEIEECKETVELCDTTVTLPESKSWVKVLYQY